MPHTEDMDKVVEAPREGGRPSRSGQGRPLTLMRHDDDVDSSEYASLLALYDTSFSNIAEGEVVKGIVLKVTENEVVVDVGYKSEGLIPIDEFIDETARCPSRPATGSTCCSRRPRTATATSCSRAKRPSG